MFYLNNKLQKVWERYNGGYIRFLWLFFLLGGCAENKSALVLYYPIDSLMSGQIKLLIEKNASLEKNASMGKKKSKIVFVPKDSAHWAKELDVFHNLNVINKPVNRNAYNIIVSKDDKSNLMVERFVAKEKDLPVQYLHIYYLKSRRNIKKLEARYRETNVMYKGSRQLLMEFRESDRIPFLYAYTVNGGQKMLLGDTVQYSVSAKVFLPH